MRKLTIGMCVYDDYEGLYFTIQSLRLHHAEVMDQVEFVIVNNNPNSVQGKAVKDFVSKITQPTQYLEFTSYSSTSLKNKIFEVADTPYAMSLDCHVLLMPGSLAKLINYYDEGKDDGNLLQGPLLHDNMDTVSTHLDREWSRGMMGRWGTDSRYVDSNSEPFEINGQGMGLFSCRKEAWLGFNKMFRKFVGEEIYIHDKYRINGKKAICLPFLQWVHRFTRVNGVPYDANWEDRYRNYIIGRIELNQEIDDVDKAFSDILSEDVRLQIKLDVIDKVSNSYDTKNIVVSSEPVFIPLSEPTKSGCGCGKG